MQDSSFIYFDTAGTQIPYDSLSDSLKAVVRDLIQQASPPSTPHNDYNQVFAALTLMVVLIAFIFIGKFIWPIIEQKLSWIKVFDSRHNNYYTGNQPVQQQPAGSDYYVYQGNKLGLSRGDITAILTKHYPFYSQLWPTVQYRFEERLLKFLHSKSFIIYSPQPYREMPVLTSAAAIHLTLGLNDYMLPWYTHIAIHPGAYFAHDTLRVLAGNVEGNIITIAWDELLKGINNPTDGSNVGLHEMAHALYYQQVIADNNREENFSAHFEKFMQEGEEMYKLKDAPHLLYSDYAYRNLQEFWAESIELFFEKPVDMMQHYPHIYNTIKGLLKLNPVNMANPLC